jgi:formate dehydrogenase major subunit
MAQVTLNGNTIHVDLPKTILQVAEEAGLFVPTFCNDKRLVPNGACRMCVVEVEGARSLVASCTTPATDGMVINTETPAVIDARKSVLELIWANHPNDCVVCDKAGQCKLQDYTYRYEIDIEAFKGAKRVSEVDQTNKFFYNDQNKCILCGKCVRVCDELQNTSAIGFSERGFHTHITHPFEEGMDKSVCVSCGNCVSVCPVGALMPKSKERFRNWEAKKVQTTCSYCGVGCQMNLIIKDNKVVDVEPVNDHSNMGLLCVKGKFGYSFIDHPDRLKKPMLKKNGVLTEVEWEEALDFVAGKIKQTRDVYGADTLAGLVSARCTNEENYLMQKLFRAGVGTNNLDHCARL